MVPIGQFENQANEHVVFISSKAFGREQTLIISLSHSPFILDGALPIERMRHYS
jgi:hypothetical protein